MAARASTARQAPRMLSLPLTALEPMRPLLAGPSSSPPRSGRRSRARDAPLLGWPGHKRDDRQSSRTAAPPRLAAARRTGRTRGTSRSSTPAFAIDALLCGFEPLGESIRHVVLNHRPVLELLGAARLEQENQQRVTRSRGSPSRDIFACIGPAFDSIIPVASKPCVRSPAGVRRLSADTYHSRGPVYANPLTQISEITRALFRRQL